MRFAEPKNLVCSKCNYYKLEDFETSGRKATGLSAVWELRLLRGFAFVIELVCTNCGERLQVFLTHRILDTIKGDKK